MVELLRALRTCVVHQTLYKLRSNSYLLQVHPQNFGTVLTNINHQPIFRISIIISLSQRQKMKVVAIFVVACIAVALAYPYDDQKMGIPRGNPVVYNQALNKWEKQTSQMQQKCDEGGYYCTIGFLVLIKILSPLYCRKIWWKKFLLTR